MIHPFNEDVNSVIAIQRPCPGAVTLARAVLATAETARARELLRTAARFHDDDLVDSAATYLVSCLRREVDLEVDIDTQAAAQSECVTELCDVDGSIRGVGYAEAFVPVDRRHAQPAHRLLRRRTTGGVQ